MRHRKSSLFVSAVCIIAFAFGSAAVSFGDDLNYAIGTEYTGNQTDTYFFDENIDALISKSIKKMIVSLSVAGFDENGGLGVKFVINGDTDSDDYYFLTQVTNTWAEENTRNHIEPDGLGTYTLEFDLSQYDEVSTILGDVWQGTVILNGIALIGSGGESVKTYGEIAEPTAGYYRPGEGRITTTSSSSLTTTSTSASSSAAVSSSTSSSSKSFHGFSFWWIAIPLLVAGAGLIATAIILTKKMK